MSTKSLDVDDRRRKLRWRRTKKRLAQSSLSDEKVKDRFVPKGDIGAVLTDVRFTPQSGHQTDIRRGQLSDITRPHF